MDGFPVGVRAVVHAAPLHSGPGAGPRRALDFGEGGGEFVGGFDDGAYGKGSHETRYGAARYSVVSRRGQQQEESAGGGRASARRPLHTAADGSDWAIPTARQLSVLASAASKSAPKSSSSESSLCGHEDRWPARRGALPAAPADGRAVHLHSRISPSWAASCRPAGPRRLMAPNSCMHWLHCGIPRQGR